MTPVTPASAWRPVNGLAVASGAILVAIALALGWRGGDLPAQVFRVSLFEREGFAIWNAQWFGGHHTPGYSVLFPPLGAVLGVGVTALASVVAAAICFDRLLPAGNRLTPLATAWFTTGLVANQIVGRLTFGLGVAVGLGALLAAARRRRLLAGVLTLACPLASPVAGAFLALVWTAVALTRRQVRAGLAALLAIGPVLAIAVAFPQGGTFPFRTGPLAGILGACLGAWVLTPRNHPVVRIAAALYAIAAIGTFLVPNPLGANIARLAALSTGPLIVVVLSGRARRVAIAVFGPALLFWQWSPALDGMVRAPDDPSTVEAFHEPLVRFLSEHGGGVARAEIPPTRRHWEAAYVAPHVPLARGWERQLDRRFNPLFYEDELRAEDYRAWLYDNGVRYVALARAPLDTSAKTEAALLARGLPYLQPVWADANWQVWEVRDATGLVDGPAELVAMTAETVHLDVRDAGDVLVRVRESPHWALEGDACIDRAERTWVRIRAHRPGRLLLEQRLLGASATWCADTEADDA